MSRLEFDAYRTDLEELSLGPRDAVAVARIDAAQQQYQTQKDKYERLRSDVIIKLKFLEENKVDVYWGTTRFLTPGLNFDSDLGCNILITINRAPVFYLYWKQHTEKYSVLTH